MAKRKSGATSDSKGEGTTQEDSDASLSSVKRTKIAHESLPEDDEVPLSEKRSDLLKSQNKKAKHNSADTSHTNRGILVSSEGDKYVELGHKRRITVRNFKGQVLIDIREFFAKDGDEKPGKKGISLTVDQWEEVKKNVSIVDSLVSQM